MASGGFTLYLVRHGRAAERGEEWPDDGKRPLTPQGIDRFQQVVRGLSVLGVTIDTILTSPLVRARQTADILAAGLRPHPSVEVIDALAPGTPVADVIAAQSLPLPNRWAILKSTSTTRPREEFAHTAAR